MGAKGIVLFRVDDRLIHGQVVVGWRRSLGANAIIVCSDRAAGDEFAKTMMEMGAPADVRVEVTTVAEGAAKLRHGEYEGYTTIVLIETPCDALALMDGGVELKKLNVGGMHFTTGKRQILEAVSVDAEDCRCLRTLAARGVDVYFQMVPNAKPAKIVERLPEDI